MTSKKTYEAIAKAIRTQLVYAETERERIRWQHMACQIANHFGNDNPRFRREQFINACGFLSLEPIPAA